MDEHGGWEAVGEMTQRLEVLLVQVLVRSRWQGHVEEAAGGVHAVPPDQVIDCPDEGGRELGDVPANRGEF